jgi:ribose/xylose/arabinose/galactoside ABC-type transport system permease subunit
MQMLASKLKGGLTLSDVLAGRSTPAWLTLGLLLIWAGLAIPGFLLPERLLALGQQVTPLLLLALGQTLVLLVGGLDISVGAVLTLSLVLASGIMQGRAEWAIPGVILCLMAGAAVGLVNGFLIEGLRLPPLIATIGMMSVVQGIAWVYTHGAPGGSVPSAIRFVANGRLGILPISDIVFAAAVVLLLLLLQRTVFGRYLYAVGANQRAAQLAGVPVKRIIIFAYILSSVLAAAGGLVLAGYVGVGTLEAGDPYVLNSIAAVIIGGTKFTGGEGGVIGTVVSVAILAVLTGILIQLGIPVTLRSVLLSIIVVAAAVLQSRRIGR